MEIHDIIKTVAKRNGVSYEDVYESMKESLLEGFNNKDPEVREAWKSIPFTGKEPTPEEFIESIHQMLTQPNRYKY